MDVIKYYIGSTEHVKIFVGICQLITAISASLLTFLVLVWGMYFACRAREFGKKVYYLKKQTDERCQEELANARVELIKSIFLTVICLAEVLDFINALSSINLHFNTRIPEKIHNNCTEFGFINEIELDPFIRYSIAVSITGILIYTSLIHTLTSYMANAYSEKRVVRLGRREKLLLLLLFTQIVVVWLSALYWRAFVFIVLLAAITIFPIHIFFFIKYSRQLYTALKRRTLDAWFEDTQQHKKLKGMCHEYKCGSIVYAVSTVLIGLTVSLLPIGTFERMVLVQKCWLNHLLDIQTDFDWLNSVYEKNKQTFSILGDITDISFNVFAVISVMFLFSLNVYILSQAVKRLVKRRRAYNTYTGTRTTELYRPLIGNK